jgi:anti-anti-sigma factor
MSAGIDLEGKTRGHSLSGVWDHLDVAVEESGDVAVVRLAGELDVHTAGKLARHLGAISPAVDRIVIDVGRVEFMDTLGLNVVLSARTRAQTEGTALMVRNAPPPVMRLLERTGVDRLLCAPFEGREDETTPADQMRLI